MWWGGEWLQTSPPLFLALGRLWIVIWGLSTESLRSFSLLFALVAGVGVQKAAMAAGAKKYSALAAAVAMFFSVGPEYFFSFKQYGAEAAAVALLLWIAARGTKWGLVAATVLLLPLAYPVAFLLPGLVLLVWHRSGARAAVTLAVAGGATLLVLYFGFIRPNVEPSLWSYWGGSWRDTFPPSVLAWIGASVGFVWYALWRRDYVLLACALPCVLLAGAEAAGWYPASPRMRLFVRPCFVVAAAVILERELAFERLAWVPPVAALVMTIQGVAGYNADGVEDYPANIAYLREHAKPEDLVLVHADARQGFLLYSVIEKWDRELRFGSTGWPCCARGHGMPKSSEQSVRADLDRMIPAGFRGRIWLVYSNRPLHWKFLGLDEGDLWRRSVWDRGCPPAEYRDLGAIVVSAMDCKAP